MSRKINTKTSGLKCMAFIQRELFSDPPPVSVRCSILLRLVAIMHVLGRQKNSQFYSMEQFHSFFSHSLLTAMEKIAKSTYPDNAIVCNTGPHSNSTFDMIAMTFLMHFQWTTSTNRKKKISKCSRPNVQAPSGQLRKKSQLSHREKSRKNSI